MKTQRWLSVLLLSLFLIVPTIAMAGKGFMGGGGILSVEESSPDDTGIPDTVEGPLNDRMSDQGKLFGDLFRILRYQGGETKLVPAVNEDGEPVYNNAGLQELVEGGAATGGEPVLSEGYAQYAFEVDEGEYELATAPYPSQCVQPVADFQKWGDISSKTGLTFNRLPLVMTYDATWKRTECEVGQLEEVTLDSVTGVITYDINDYFLQPMEEWNGITYCDGVKWAEMVDEVHFGRLNLSRSPEAVLQAAFDEAISAINNATNISRDAAGRLLLTTEIWDEFSIIEGDVCVVEKLDTVVKAIDSPLENLALYVKLMKDGHLITPGDERQPIDRSERGGIPLWKMLELSDGPSDALRPTVNVMDPDNSWRSILAATFPNLVDASDLQEYYTYYQCYKDELKTKEVDCLCEGTSHDGFPIMVACPDVVRRDLIPIDEDCTDYQESCTGPYFGIKTRGEDTTSGDDFDFAAAFLSAAADKTGEISVDLLVYINSILGINQVVGYSEYDDDGQPTDGAVDYSKNPVYFDYAAVTGYARGTGVGRPIFAPVLQSSGPGAWTETDVNIYRYTPSLFNNLGLGDDGFPNGDIPASNILGFTQMADDDLGIIEFIHTFQIPGLR